MRAYRSEWGTDLRQSATTGMWLVCGSTLTQSCSRTLPSRDVRSNVCAVIECRFESQRSNLLRMSNAESENFAILRLDILPIYSRAVLRFFPRPRAHEQIQIYGRWLRHIAGKE